MVDFVVSQNAQQNPYQEFTYVVAATTGRVRINYATSYFRALSVGTGGALGLRFAGAGNDTSFTGVGIGLKLPFVIEWVELINTGSSDITVTVAMGIVDILDTRFSSSSTITATVVPGTVLVDAADVAVLTVATTKVITTNAATRTVIISNLVANGTKIRVGTSSAGAARGVEVANGGSISLDTSADVYVYNPSGSTINIGVLSLRS